VFDKVEDVSYIRPATISFYKKFKDAIKVKKIYDDIIKEKNKFFYRRYESYNVEPNIAQMKEIIEQHEEEFLFFEFTKDEERIIIDKIKMRMTQLNQDDRRLFEQKLKIVEPIFYSSEYKSAHSKIEILFNNILDIYFFNDIGLSESFYKEEFEETDIFDAVGDLLIFGKYLRDKRYGVEAILDFDKWDTRIDSIRQDVDEIKNMVYNFTLDYGLMGLLGRVYQVESHEWPHNSMNMEINTILNEFDIEKNIDINDAMYLSKTMKVVHYCKLFFPEIISISYFPHNRDSQDLDFNQIRSADEHNMQTLTYLSQGKVYRTQYSEPIFMFLLAVKWFYNEYQKFQGYKSIDKEKFADNKTSTNITFKYSDKCGYIVHQYTFNSLIDALMYYSKKSLLFNNENWIVCKVCGTIEKKKTIKWKYPVCQAHRNLYKNQICKERKQAKEPTAVKQEMESARP